MFPLCTTLQLRSLFSKKISFEEFSKYWIGDGSDAAQFSRSRWAIVSVARQREIDVGKKPVFWFPSYICSEAYSGLIAAGYEVKFYSWQAGPQNIGRPSDVLANVEAGVDVIVYVHYFGFTPSKRLSDWSEFARVNDLLMVEDAAHCPIPSSQIGVYGHYVIYSPYKHYAMESGSILVSRSGPISVNAEAVRELCTRKGVIFRKSKPFLYGVLKEIYRHFFGSRYSSQFVGSGQRDIFDNPVLFGYSMLFSKDVNFDELRSLRSRVSHAWELMAELLGIKSDISYSSFDYEFCYMMPVKVESKALFEKCIKLNVPLIRWPDTDARECGDQPMVASTADYYLPVNPSISVHHIFKLCSTIKGLSSNQREVEDLFPAGYCGETPLVQTTSYIHARTSGRWRPFRYESNKFSVAGRAFELGFIKLCIINLGPIFKKNATLPVVENIFSQLPFLIFNKYSSLKLTLITPYFQESGLSDFLMWSAGYVRVGRFSAWESSKIRLADVDSQKVRSGFTKKWRNQLNKAESFKGIVVDVSSDSSDILRIYDKSANYLRSIDVQPIPRDLVCFLSEKCITSSVPSSNLEVITASLDGQVQAGIVVAYTQHEATYLIGWSSSQGRQMYLNQLLLWRGITRSLERGVASFDTGGIDFIKSPGVASFKVGMGGSRYRLAGTYLKVPLLLRSFMTALLR